MGKITVDENICKGCGMCVFACPVKIIELAEEINAKGYHPARCVQPEKCIGCASCAMMCPDVAITVEKETREKAEKQVVK
ncbi:4Fe-4S dicluster domain-containing protein [Scatolibacter rhodanostii]|uniref:4Fe-4S dicluster domain-containing protein n=1 Tax=Scatolibacter rhodanostii TaxID=2014781 RepID=UPI000C0765CD|nr:4Fe-4S dicluster domain-containing protein [Scatolibacter rhodanostii]